MSQKLKTVSDKLLRGGLCGVYLFAFVMAFYFFLDAETSDAMSDQSTFFIRMLICAAIGTIAALSHAYLIYIAEE